MKRNSITKTALVYLITGLLLVVLVPITGRYFQLSDATQGFLTGSGLMLEFIALLMIDRGKKQNGCAKF